MSWIRFNRLGQSQKPPEGDVVRITTNLVQIDAVITDKSGKLITDLKSEELQLLGQPATEDYTFLLHSRRQHRRPAGIEAFR